jgi:molybdate transport system substrate-binding protein
MELRLISGGAAQAVVMGLKDAFEQAHGCTIVGTFGAVGTMRDKLLAGEACDLAILSAGLIEALQKDGQVAAGSARPLGIVDTGVAVRDDAPDVAIGDGDALKATLAAARGLYVPSMAQSTAGGHVAAVLRKLSLEQEMAGRIHEYPNGNAAMHDLAQSKGDGMIGCTQATEIMYTQGVRLVGLLPAGYELSTVYTAARCAKAAQPELAQRFIEALSGTDSQALRQRSGFRL